MATWIEFRCEMRSRTTTDCWSHSNSGPMGLACDDLASIKALLADLRREAIGTGWRRTKDGWVCPACAHPQGVIRALKQPETRG